MARHLLILSFLFSFVVDVRCQNDLNYFLGNWQLEVYYERSEDGKPDFTLDYNVEKALDTSFCFLVHVNEKRRVSVELMSFDTESKLYMRSAAHRMGVWLAFTSNGWRGDTLVWNGTQVLGKEETAVKEEVTRQGDNTFKVQVYSFENKNWRLISTKIYQRK